MVSPQVVRSQNSGDKSPSPETFKEPEGMVSIDLNKSKNSSESKTKSTKRKNPKGRIVAEIIIILFLLNIIVFGILIFLNQETYVFKTKPPSQDNNNLRIDNDDNINTDIEDVIKNCILTNPLKICCILFSTRDTKFSNFCNIQNALSLTTDIDIRKRRDVSAKKSKTSPKEPYQYNQYLHVEPINLDRYYFYEDNNDFAYDGPLGEFVYYPDEYINYPEKDLSHHHDVSKFHYRASDSKGLPENKATKEQDIHSNKQKLNADIPKNDDNGKISDSLSKQNVYNDISGSIQTKPKIKSSNIHPPSSTINAVQQNNTSTESKIPLTVNHSKFELVNKDKVHNESREVQLDNAAHKKAKAQPDKINIPIKITEEGQNLSESNNDAKFSGKVDTNRQNGTKLINRASRTSVEDNIDIPGSKISNQDNFKDGSNIAHDPRNRDKGDISLTMSQQAMFNPCLASFGQYSPTLTSNNQLFKIVPAATSKFSPVMLNPPLYPYIQAPYMIPQQMVPNFVPSMNQQVQNAPVRVNGPGGQFYMCNPISTPTNNVISNSIANMPGVEVRREAANLQDLIVSAPKPNQASNKGRASEIVCPLGYVACADDSKCIPKHHFCDNEAHCTDGSDEMFCTCKERVGKLRICDGYFDCPDGEDELGCFGCEKDEFSCDDWSKFRKSTCIPIEQRCDNIRQCDITGKDEEDCSVLSDNTGEQPLYKISNAIGFLHRNYRGKWYPTCFGTELWAVDVCKIESGPISVFPRIHMVLTTDSYEGSFINILPNKEISLVKNCVGDRAAFVECPAIFCGMRITIKNPYRSQEVDISAETIINDLERVANRHHVPHGIGEHNAKTAQSSSNNDEPILGDSRVVGGKPSQPAAWPWLVSIYRNGMFHCGGVLIHETWIITAAHCTDRYWQYYFEIEAGALRRFSFAPMQQHRWATLVINNESYDKGTLRNDIALIKLSDPVRFNRYVRPICLPSESTAGRNFNAGPAPGTICTTVGWGATIEHGSDPDHMREVEVPILDRCKHRDDIWGNEICAGLSEGGKDTCQGDSGGPLMCRNPNNPNQWYLAGIVSHGEGCARPDEPGVYTKVGKYVAWIVENMDEEKFITKSPLQHCPGYVCKASKKCLPKKRRCDKIIDCLFGDDETDCNMSFQNLFKHARRNKHHDNSEGDSILKGSIPALSTAVLKMFDSPADAVDTSAKNKDKGNITSTATTATASPSESSTHFMCSNLIQLIPSSKFCNTEVDCEDGTDETNCRCVDYVRSQNPKAVCDGITDCFDLSDEQCVKCKEDEYYCRLSQICIDISKRCNGITDCSKHEDEWDCVALTNGRTLILDPDARPELSDSGVITINHNGTWKPFCLDSTEKSPATIVSNVCDLLGFEQYLAYREYQAEDKPLKQKGAKLPDKKEVETVNKEEDDVGKNKTCAGLYVKCSNVSLDTSIHDVHLDNVSDEIELYAAPWNAVIYSDGIYRCMGAILNSQWIVTSVNCFEGITELRLHYVTVLLGKGKATLQVKGAHEQTLRIVESEMIPNTDIVLLRTEKNIIYSRYIKHLRLNLRRDGIRQEKCIAIGLHNNKAKYEYLRPIQNCKAGFRCFETKLKTDCKDSCSWSGTIVCDSGSGWYAASVYFEQDGFCGLSSVRKYTSVPYHRKRIRDIMEQISSSADAPHCNGFRCTLGECIAKNKTCDGIPQCREAEDEETNLCYQNERMCHLTDECECHSAELKCENKKCIPKANFCDRKDDCGDVSDEPVVCDCRSYLQLTNSRKICDGVVNCMDRTDEDPLRCPCRSNGLKCLSLDRCISNDMICDGIEDCPNGEDEKQCLNIVTEHNEPSNAGELQSRTGGIWHSGCFHSNYSQEELEKICQDLGYAGGTSHQLTPPKNIHNLTASRAVIDDFDIVWIRRGTNKFKLGLRTGNDPYVSFIPDENCYKLYLACL